MPFNPISNVLTPSPSVTNSIRNEVAGRVGKASRNLKLTVTVYHVPEAPSVYRSTNLLRLHGGDLTPQSEQPWPAFKRDGLLMDEHGNAVIEVAAWSRDGSCLGRWRYRLTSTEEVIGFASGRKHFVDLAPV